MRIEGTLKFWNVREGIRLHRADSLGEQEIFVHIKAFDVRLGRPQIGQRLTFEIELSAEGKKRAKRVQLLRWLVRVTAGLRIHPPSGVR